MATLSRLDPAKHGLNAPIAGARRGLAVITIGCATQETVLRSLTALDIPVQTCSSKPSGRQFEAVLRLRDPGDGPAESAAEMIAAWPQISWVRLEHRWLPS